MELSKNHDPEDNKALIRALLKDKRDERTVSEETWAYFDAIRTFEPLPAVRAKRSFRSPAYWTEPVWRLLAERLPPFQEPAGFGDPEPAWTAVLDEQYNKLQDTRAVDVTAYGAVGDGRTDSTAAFKKALGNGHRTVHVPAGVFVVKGIQLPDWSRLKGAGKSETILRLHEDASPWTRLVTNKDYRRGNRNIAVEDLTLDWNLERIPAGKRTKKWGNYASCLTYVHVTYGWVKRVAALNPGLHCFDISSPLYSYAGDGYRAKNGSRFIHLDSVTGSGFGDDGVTTHHSEWIIVSNSHFCDPSGRAHREGFSNSNGIEVDDGSRYVWLHNNSTARCFGGIECKAHADSSAGAGVTISGHLSYRDNRSFNFRHIGHHKGDDPLSRSATHICAERLVSIEPAWTHLYKSSSPRALVVSAFRNVAVNRFRFIGSPGTAEDGQPAVSLQYRARNISLTNGSIEGFGSTERAVALAKGKDGVRNVTIRHISSASQEE